MSSPLFAAISRGSRYVGVSNIDFIGAAAADPPGVFSANIIDDEVVLTDG